MHYQSAQVVQRYLFMSCIVDPDYPLVVLKLCAELFQAQAKQHCGISKSKIAMPDLNRALSQIAYVPHRHDTINQQAKQNQARDEDA